MIFNQIRGTIGAKGAVFWHPEGGLAIILNDLDKSSRALSTPILGASLS